MIKVFNHQVIAEVDPATLIDVTAQQFHDQFQQELEAWLEGMRECYPSFTWRLSL